MDYKLYIEWEHQPSLIRVTLKRRFMWLWIFECWLVEESRVCSHDNAFEWVCAYVDGKHIPIANIHDFTQNIEA